ncbi:TRF2-interacting telomeric protein/Rap1 C terminal domain-containing protein [Nemania abortiva]|nr:TRF2-interacting telomeric protein/Rap1 C terminal domain-containing protein [Nemania abortiva]
MSAPGITYSGVLARKHASNSTDTGVFGGLKFWLSLRVPNRKSCVDTIQENGGVVVPKEGNADMLICDPAKGALPGSYSHELIADAVKEGSLGAKEDYLCSSLATDADLPSRLNSKPKLTRNKFTEKDDQMLIKFVSEKERLGEPVSGNDIYKEFAEDHPHHTWQSWRDRWVKKLRSIPRPPTWNKEQLPQPKTTQAAPLQRVTNKSTASRARARFTAEEDDIILEAIHNAIENHEPWNGHQTYKRLASELPQRTYESWRERALNHVAKQNKDLIAQWELEITFPDEEDVEDQQTRMNEDKASTNLLHAGKGGEAAATRAVNKQNKDNSTHRSIDEDDDDQRPKNTLLSSMQKNKSVEPSPDSRLQTRNNALNYSSPSPTPNTPNGPDLEAPITTEQQFYRDYNTFLESAGITDRRIPSVRGRAIALWDLWQSVRSKKVEVAELDWQQIAEGLGFDWVSIESIPDDIRHCYEEHLAPFADAMMNFNDSSDEEDSASENADAETEGLLPSSPPVLPSLKRPSAATDTVYKYPFLQSSPKRRRIDRGYEIPSTPENANRALHSQSLDPNGTPTSSPLSNYGAVKRATLTQARLNGKRDGLPDLPVQPQGRKRRLEPETQDFNFDPDTQAYAHDEASGHFESASQREMTPSQQLLLESDAISPTLPQDAPTPTPRRRSRALLQSDDYNDSGAQRHSKSTSNAGAPRSTQKAQRQRRTLPSSWASQSPITTDSEVPQEVQSSYTTVPETEPRKRPTPPKETPDDIIDHFVSLGYSRNIVLRSLKATSWIIGNAGQVMEMLKQGEPLPTRTTGVWTERDDESLALVFSKEPPSDAKGEKKVAKEMKRLQAKHGDEQIALRKKYLLDELPE